MMKKKIMVVLLLMASILSSEAQAVTITIKNDCTTFVVVSAYSNTNRSTKIGEQVVWPSTSAVITTSQCVQSIQTASTVVGTLYNYYYPTTCKNIKLTITKKLTSCGVAFSEE